MTRGPRIRSALVACAAIAAAAYIIACAATSQGPPGAAPHTAPPHLVRATPDSGAVRVHPRAVEFTFDEVVSESPRGPQDLQHLVLISPSDGTLPNVDWHRQTLSIRPKRGWRTNTTYVVTLLAGLADLHNNTRDTSSVLVFSTGDNIPDTRLRGVVFDWVKNAFAPHAYVEAHPQGDTTIRFATEADSVGRYLLPFLTPGLYVVRALLDANRNHALDAREAWDTIAVTLRDSIAADFYTFVHDPRDTLGPRLGSVSVTDSVTLHLTFELPLSPAPGYVPTVRVVASDSSPVAVARVMSWTELTNLRTAADKAHRDSLAAKDTSASARAARQRAREDSVNRAAALADSIAKDTVRRAPPPKPARPPLITDVGVVLELPLKPASTYRLTVEATGVLGATRTTPRSFTTAKPSPPRGGPDVGAGRGRGGVLGPR